MCIFTIWGTNPEKYTLECYKKYILKDVYYNINRNGKIISKLLFNNRLSIPMYIRMLYSHLA